MKIEYNLDYSEPLNESELLGDVYIFGNDNSEISENDTFVDSWLLAMSEGLNRLVFEESCVIDIPEEPNPLIFDKETGQIRYGNQVVSINNFNESLDNLKKVIDNFLKEVDVKREEGVLRLLRKFLESSR